MNYTFMQKSLRMPYIKHLGYYQIGDDKIYSSIDNDKKHYFDEKQKELVIKNIDIIKETELICLPRPIVDESELIIGDTILKCSVLNDGRRILKDTSLFSALDRTRKGETRIEGFPPIIGSKNLACLFKELYPNEIDIISPFEVAQLNGTIGKWYNAEALPILCDLYMEAESRNEISSNQKHVLAKAKILLRSLAKVGITALVDEATNYQDSRGKDELQILLAKFISEELQAYSKEFPKEYFENLFRIYGIPYDPTSNKRPLYFSRFNIRYVYELFPPNVWEKLDEINPPIWNIDNTRKRRKYHIYRHLNESGIQHLRTHLNKLIPVMKLSSDIDDFKNNFKIVFKDELYKIEQMKAYTIDK